MRRFVRWLLRPFLTLIGHGGHFKHGYVYDPDSDSLMLVVVDVFGVDYQADVSTDHVRDAAWMMIGLADEVDQIRERDYQ